MAEKRADRTGTNRTAFEKNARYIYKTREVCGICGLPVDMSLKSPDPMSKTIDHIIPVSKGGHPSDLSNLQLAHRCCNRQKGDKLFIPNMALTGAGYNDPGSKNTPPLQNNPGYPKQPAPHKPTGEIKPGQEKQADSKSGHETAGGAADGYPERGRRHQMTRATADNDNLPQHADWSTFVW